MFIGLVASIYLLKDKEFFLSLWQKFLSMILKQKVHGVTNEILGEINNVLTTFIKGALIDSLIVAFLSSLALSLVKVEYAVIIGIIGGLLNIIPYFGPFFGMVPAFLVALTTNGLGQAIIAVLALLGVQQIDSNYIYPKVVGSSTGLHPLFVLLSVSIFGYFGGIVGMLLAVPAAGIIQILIKKMGLQISPFFYANVMVVPVFPSRASTAFEREVIMAFFSGLALTNFMAASTFGSMLPGANCPCVQYRSASMRFIDLISRWSGLLKFMATFSTSVNISSVSA